ncbi:Imm1 family immunity protein [Streptoalloteichus hindustanus]|uniref:Imm1 family immunity protein n=1 Tax=Streptoalloteichus hindustanus TaxID=2017 RepID=UPI0009365CF0|nr:Imm1 family immunity protein [Streptoalloteichus hindustanus]
MAAGTYFHNPSSYVVERPTYGPAEVPDHAIELDVDVAAELGALAYAGPEPEGGPWISLSDSPHPEAELYQDLGSGYRFPADAVIPLGLVREAVLEFRRSGGRRPTCVEWQPADGF